MGKAANNERIKLTAMFYNNVSVGATITGSIVPILAYARELVQNDNEFTGMEMAATCLVILVAAFVAVFCRARASSVISRIED
jgi:hypothetical protein